jgi:hypothetical protein
MRVQPIAMTEGDGIPESRHGASRRSRRWLAKVIGFAVAGGTLAGGLVGSLMSTGNIEAANLDSLPTTWLSRVQGTLAPNSATQLIEDARRCREPLARVAIWHSSGARGGVMSIRSGGYQSPQFVLTGTPSTVALPYPPPYSSGRGVLTIEGEAQGVVIALEPQHAIADLKNNAILPVWWNPAQGCQ